MSKPLILKLSSKNILIERYRINQKLSEAIHLIENSRKTLTKAELRSAYAKCYAIRDAQLAELQAKIDNGVIIK